MLAEEGKAYSGVEGQKIIYNFRRARGLPVTTDHDPRGAKPVPRGAPVSCQSHVFFTFVREPISTFIAGWQQVMCFQKRNVVKLKLDVGNHSLKDSGRETPPVWVDSARQFRVFLDDFLHYRALGPAATHVYPQADKVDALPMGCKFSFIGNLETLRESMIALFPAIGAKTSPRHLPPHGHKAEDEECKVRMKKTFKYGPEEIRMLCRALYADFICFGYRFPPECGGLDFAA